MLKQQQEKLQRQERLESDYKLLDQLYTELMKAKRTVKDLEYDITNLASDIATREAGFDYTKEKNNG